MLKRQRRKLMLKWRRAQLRDVIEGDITPEQLADALSVENLPTENTPKRHERAIVEFRHLRRDSRIAACRSFLNDGGQKWPF